MTVLLILCCLLAQAQVPSTQVAPRVQPLVWQFTRGQEFFVEENHRQLYLVKSGETRVNSYLDYSLLERYQVKSVQGRQVELEATWEKVRVNNLSEAGKEAVEALKKKEGTKRTYYLRKQDRIWQLDPNKHPTTQEAIFSTLLFTLGTASFDADHPAWAARWPMSIPSQGQVQLVMKMQTKPTENPLQWRNEVRAEFELVPEESAESSVQLENIPSATPGLAFFDARNSRWFYLDFRVICVFKTIQAGRQAEVKQDFTAVYRVYDSKPFWSEK